MKRVTMLLLISVLALGLTLSGCNAVNDMFGKLFGKGQTPNAPQGGPGVPLGPGAPTGPTMPGGSITESGYLSGPGASYTFTINAGSVSYLEVPFTYPKGSVKFWVKVVGQDGNTVLGDFDLDNGEIIQLSGGGTFYLTVYSRTGAGNWSATYSLAGGSGTTTNPGSGGGGNCNTSGNAANGYLTGPGDSCSFTINAGSKTYVEVPFTYPKGSVDFWVEVVGQDGYTVLGDFDLDNGEVIQLSGGGTFYVTVYSKMGAGNWSATY